MISVYYTSWKAQWVSDPAKMDLALITENYPGVNCVNISFAKPDMSYNTGSFAGTGLEFSLNFSVVAGAIKILRAKQVTVMLSIGGGAYWSTHKETNVTAWANLANDLGCDGIDIDWEADVNDDTALTKAIIDLDKIYRRYISFAGWSTGAYGKDGDANKGKCINAMINAGNKIDWINIMTYDAGPTFDPLGAFDCYRIYYKGPLNIGFEIGEQAWGGYLITDSDVIRMTDHVKKESSDNGVFIWCLGKTGTPSVKEVISMAGTIFNTKPQPPTTPLPPTPVEISCKVCNSVYILKK